MRIGIGIGIGFSNGGVGQTIDTNALILKYTDINSEPFDVSDVSAWNTFFDLPTNGTPFTSIVINGNAAFLYGGANISVSANLFENNTNLKQVVDRAKSIVFVDDYGFSATGLTKAHLLGCVNMGTTAEDGASFYLNELLTDVYFPLLENGGDYGFQGCTLLTSVNDTAFPALTNSTNGIGLFQDLFNATSFYFPNLQIVPTAFFSMGNVSGQSIVTEIRLDSCTSLGATVGYDQVFSDIIGQTITLTVPSALMTCNGGEPDGDIQYLVANNTVTIIQV